jgi:hypothetical protein
MKPRYWSKVSERSSRPQSKPRLARLLRKEILNRDTARIESKEDGR